MFKSLLPPPFPPIHSQTSFGNTAKRIRRQVIFAIFLPTCMVAPGKSFPSMYLSTFFLPVYCPSFHFKFTSTKKKNTFLAFSHRGWLTERAQQQTSDLLLPSISYPETLVSSLFLISRKMYSCSHPSYPRFKTLLWNLKGSVRLFKDSDACFIFGSRVCGEQE